MVLGSPISLILDLVVQFEVCTEIMFPDNLIGTNFIRSTMSNYFPVQKDIYMVNHCQGCQDIMIYDHDSHSEFHESANILGYFLYDDRVKASKGFIQ